MNTGGQIRPPFFGQVGNMPTGQLPPPPFVPNVPPPNFSLPPPNMHQPANFPRFSGPMYNQPTFHPVAGGGNMNVPPPPLSPMNLPPPVYNVANNNNNFNRGGMNQASQFNQRSPGQMPNGNKNNFNNNNNVNSNQHAFPNNQQRQMQNFGGDIFNDAPKDVQSGFPHFKPTAPAPLQQNCGNLLQMPPTLQQRGGIVGGAGTRGFHQGNRGFHNNNGNNNNNHSNNNRGRGGFHGGMNNRGRGNFHNNKGRGGNNINGGQQGFQKKNEPKVDKRDLPENNAFFCDTCDRGFKTEEKYMEHVAQHQKCSYKDCPFVAAPKLVQLHMNMQHRKGLANKIYNVKSEEEIKKWREERRKNYPTAENMKKKKERMEERIARGEVIETKEFGKMKNNSRRNDCGRGRGRGRFGRGRGYHGDEDTKRVIDVDDDDDDAPPEEKKIERSSKEDEKDPIDLTNTTDSSDPDKPGKLKSNKSIVDLTESPAEGESKINDTSLTLLTGYGSASSLDSGESSDDEDKDKEQTDKKTITKKAEHIIFNDESKDDRIKVGAKVNGLDSEGSSSNVKEIVCEPEKIQEKTVINGVGGTSTTTTTNESGTSKAGSSQEVKAVKRGHPNKGGPPGKKPKFAPRPPPKSYTLLEKLLAKEIRRERNKILQCVHFIVKNKFFDSISE